MSAQVAQKQPASWLRATVAGIAGLFYAYAIWNAIAYLVTMAQLGLNGYGWFLLLFAVAFPIIVFVLANVLGRKRALGELALVLIAGLGLTAVFWMNVLAYATLNTIQLLG